MPFAYGFWFYEELAEKLGIRPGLHHWDEGDREDSYIHLTVPNGTTYEVKASSFRYELFRQNPKCVNCHRVGQLWILEAHHKSDRPHLNLYHVGAESKDWKNVCPGGLVLMTKDHIIPKSKGGPTRLDNLQTMCTICNMLKADNLPRTLTPEQQRFLESREPKGEMQSLSGLPHFI